MPAEQSANRIVSTNPCIDAVLVELVDPNRIEAISEYSKIPTSSSIPADVAARFKATSGTAEEVIALAPDLVLIDSFAPLATRDALARAGIRMLTLSSPTTIAESRTQITTIAAALGEPARGRDLVARIDQAVDSAPHGVNPISALLWHGGSGMVSGGGTLVDEMMVRAGFRNAAADYGLQHTGFLPLEHVVMHPPRVMLTPLPEGRADGEKRALTLRQQAMEAFSDRITEAEFPERLLFCGGPTIIPAMKRLTEIRRTIPS